MWLFLMIYYEVLANSQQYPESPFIHIFKINFVNIKNKDGF